MYVCTICDKFAGRSFAAVLRHIGSSHRYDPGLRIRCGIKSCPETYTVFESFRSHVYRKHREELHLDPRETSHPGNGGEELLTVSDPPLGDEIGEESSIVDQAAILQSSAAKFLLKAKEECKLTQVSLDRIVSSMRGLWEQAMELLRQQLEPSLPSQVDAPIFHTRIFDGLETQYLQHKYYRENFSYIVS